jgi:myo-inositol-1(or 4)-monophosphatase
LNKRSKFQWIIDPLDGTYNYIYGFPNFGVSIALAKGEKVQLGVIYLPHFNDIYFAERGLGAFLNDESIKVLK